MSRHSLGHLDIYANLSVPTILPVTARTLQPDSMIIAKAITVPVSRFHGLLIDYRYLFTAAYIEGFVFQRLRGLEFLRLLFAVFVFGLPFLLPYIFSYFAIPTGYEGIRNEELEEEDRDNFELDKAPLYQLIDAPQPV